MEVQADGGGSGMRNERTCNPTNDVVFKFVFGREEHKRITLHFINDILGREGEDAFVDIQFRNTELAPDKHLDKLGRLDVFGVLNDGTRVDIEMQVINHMNLEKRSLFYQNGRKTPSFSYGDISPLSVKSSHGYCQKENHYLLN